MTNSFFPPQDIYIIGVGMTPAGEHWEKSLRELALEAMIQARHEAGELTPDALYVANMLAPSLSRQSHLGALLADFAGLRGIEAVTLEAAGASGGMALRHAVMAIASGLTRSALVVGVEKFSERISSEIEAALSTTGDADFESIHGVTQTALAAMLMRRYQVEFKAPADAFAGFSITAHANGAGNPRAMFQRPIKAESYQRAGMVSEPLNMFDAAPLADGAAALMVAAADAIPADSRYPKIRIAASSASVDAVALHDRHDPLFFSAVRDSIAEALQQAGLTRDQINLFELHDRYTIYSALTLEAAGYADRGKAWELAHNGHISLGGNLPITTFGGSKARGDTGGANGVYQAAEAVLQLQDRAGENQVKGAQNAMILALGGAGATAVTHILSRSEPY
jgi:acetyl-CoA C-acetyltransferase